MHKKHFFLGNKIAEAKEFSPQNQGFGGHSLPTRDRVTHARMVKEQYETVVNQVVTHLEEREKGITSDIVSGQVKKAFQGLSESEASKVVIAYEPVWAIGTGKTATPQDADDVHKTIRETLKSLYNDKIADNTIILYGGSVNEKNADD